MFIKNVVKKTLSVILSLGLINVVPFSVKAEEAETLKNVALGKSTSSTNRYAPNFDDKYAVDGNINTSWASGGQEAENKYTPMAGENATIVVDLEENHMISEIYVRTRRDMDQTYTRRNWQVYVSDTADFKNQKLVGEKKLSGLFKEDLEIKFKSPQKMRYIKVTCTTTDSVVISEIEAYGYAIGSEETGFAEYNDMESSEASYLLSQLGIIPRTTQFNPLMLVTRAEAASNMLKLLNCEAYSGKKYFNDVSEDNEYFKEISVCCELGIIMQSYSFRPNDFVTRREYLTMVLRTLGYTQLEEQNIELTAQRLKLYKNTNFSGGEYVNNENAMWIMYNALMCKPMRLIFEKKSIQKTLLEYSYKIDLKNGVVTANNETTLDTPQTKKKSYIEIDNVAYDDQSELIYKYLGKNVKYAVDDKDDKKIKFAFVDFDLNNEKIISCKDIEEVTRDTVSYFDKDGKVKRINIKGAKVLKNHSAYTDYINETEYFQRPDGYLELTDNNDDGRYDVINIMEPTIIEVENVSTSDGLKIADKSGNIYDFSQCDHISITLNGRSTTEKGISAAKLLLMYMSSDNLNAYIEGVYWTVTGKIVKVDEDDIQIDDKEYILSDYFMNNVEFTERLIGGRNETFYYSGNTIYSINEKTLQSDNIKIGFILRAGYDDHKTQVELRVYTSDGEFHNLYINKSLVVDGTKWSIDKLLQDYKYFNKKFILFKNTVDGRVTWIDTEITDSDEGADSLRLIDHSSGEEWRATSDGVWEKYKMIAPANKTIPVFEIPWSGGDFATGSNSEAYYGVTEFSKIYNYNGKPISSNVVFYKTDDTEYIGFACAPKTVPTGVGMYSSSNDANAPMVIMSSMASALNEEGDEMRQLVCVNISSGSEVKYFLPDELKYAIKAPEIINDGLSSLYNSSDNTIKRSVTIPNDYLVNIENLKRGYILRVQSYGNYVVGLEIMEGNYSIGDKIYCGSNGLGGIWSGILTMNAEIEEISDGKIKYNNGEGSAWKDYGEFEYCCIISKRAIEKVKNVEVPQYFKSGDRVFMQFKNGKAVSLIVWH